MTKVFAKCRKCGHTFFTEHINELVTLVSGERIYVCWDCKQPLDSLQLTLCSRDLSQDCDTCEHRYQCFSCEPI